jgi:hypothetical protein
MKYSKLLSFRFEPSKNKLIDIDSFNIEFKPSTVLKNEKISNKRSLDEDHSQLETLSFTNTVYYDII